MKKSLKYKIVLAIVIIVCIMDVSFIFVNYVNYLNVNRNYTDSLAQTVANTCRLVVDGDSVTGYLDNRRRNTAYYEVWNKLIEDVYKRQEYEAFSGILYRASGNGAPCGGRLFQGMPAGKRREEPVEQYLFYAGKGGSVPFSSPEVG